MITEVNFLQSLHTATKRDYLARMNAEKPECMRIAKQYGRDYWDGDRKYGYGGYHYDGRWKPIAEAMVVHYGLESGSSIFDIGCGKGHLLCEFTDINPKIFTRGIDISRHAIDCCPPKVDILLKHNCIDFPGYASACDLVYSINVFHNLSYRDLKLAIKEMVRISKDKRYICVESYRTEEELCNLQCWALTCQSFYAPDDWKEILTDSGYAGDIEFITFS